MNQRAMRIVAVPVVVMAMSLQLMAADGEVVDRPRNVVMVLIDDLGYGDLAAHGNPLMKTPGLDALHGQSARFTNFAVSPSCAGTRCALLTGRHEFKSAVTHTINPMRIMALSATTIADLFQKKGFATGIFGKWHLGQKGEHGPWSRGFDETLTVAGDFQNTHHNPRLLKNRKPTKFKGYRTDILFDEAMGFIERNKDRPFFCYLPTYTPHAPLKAPSRYVAPYKGVKGINAQYAGMVASVDENIVRLTAKLNELQLDDNTLVILLTDNGGTFGVDTFNAGMRGTKGSAWQGGIRAVSLWRWGSRYTAGPRAQMTGHVDVFPTLTDLFDLDTPANVAAGLDGDSLRPLLERTDAELQGERIQVHHRGLWKTQQRGLSHKYTHCTVRWKQYQLVRIESCADGKCRQCRTIRSEAKGRALYSRNHEHYQMTNGKWALYDIFQDPFQKKDIADRHPKIVKKLETHYDRWWTDVSKVLAQSRPE